MGRADLRGLDVPVGFRSPYSSNKGVAEREGQMVQRPRKPVGRGYTETFQVTDSAGASELSRTLEATWSEPSRGEGGDALDDLLSGLGQAYVDEGRVKWIAPSNLDASFREYLSQSVDELNKRLEAGELIVDEDGNIRPPN
jgi:hypothetical protein